MKNGKKSLAPTTVGSSIRNITSNQVLRDDVKSETSISLNSQVDGFLKRVEESLRDHGCDRTIAVDIDPQGSGPQIPIPVKVMEEDECARGMLYKYFRKCRNLEENIRLKIKFSRKFNEITSFSVSGALVEYNTFQVIMDLMKLTRTLTALSLIDCSLNAEAIMILSKAIRKTQISSLYLDRNPIKEQNYNLILRNNKVLQHLSLAQCHIDENGVYLLSRELGPPTNDRPAHFLKSLNLNNNRICCIGAKNIAQGLKWNKDLVVLSLAGNRIGNAGMEFISKAMRPSPLEKWEKKLREDRIHQRCIYIMEKLKEEHKIRNKIGQEEEESEGSIFSDLLNRQSDSEGIIKSYITSDPNYLNTDVIEQDGILWTNGNNTLRILDITYNKIEEIGFVHLLETLRFQLKERELIKDRNHLVDVKVLGNFCPENSEVLLEIYNCLLNLNMEEEHVEEELQEDLDENQNITATREEKKTIKSETKETQRLPEFEPKKKTTYHSRKRTERDMSMIKKLPSKMFDDALISNIEEILTVSSVSESSTFDETSSDNDDLTKKDETLQEAQRSSSPQIRKD